jgi:hypothetical protein
MKTSPGNALAHDPVWDGIRGGRLACNNNFS